MSNTLTNLIPDLMEALDVVSRELTGYIPAASRSSGAERAALGQSVRVPITAAAAGGTNTPGVTPPDDGDETIDNVEITISKSLYRSVRWNGEERRGLVNAGTFASIQADRFYQAMRSLVNVIEADLHLEAYTHASRAHGVTIGTAPFATANDMSDIAGVLRILEENGAPPNDLQLVLGHAAMANLRGKQASLFKVNEAGSADMLRNGMTDRLMGFAIRHSNAVALHTAGAGAGADLTGNEAIGSTVLGTDGITSNTTGYIAGDIITIATGDANKYVINTGLGDVSSGDLVINKPGLRVAHLTNDEITHAASYTPNVAFARSAIVLATRPPALPEGGDSAQDVITITDPRTGLSFDVAEYKQFLQTSFHVRLAWGYKAIKPEHIAILHG